MTDVEKESKSRAGPNPVLQLVTTAPIVVVTLLAASLFAFSRGAYGVFYREYGVSPGELGLDYVTILTQQAFPIALLIILILCLAAPFLFSLAHPSRRTRAAAKRERDRERGQGIPQDGQ